MEAHINLCIILGGVTASQSLRTIHVKNITLAPPPHVCCILLLLRLMFWPEDSDSTFLKNISVTTHHCENLESHIMKTFSNITALLGAMVNSIFCLWDYIFKCVQLYLISEIRI